MGIFKNTLFESVKSAFTKTRSSISEKLTVLFTNKQIDVGDIEEIENILLQSDFGLDFTELLTAKLKKTLKSGEQVNLDSLKEIVREVFVSEYNSSVQKTDEIITNPHFILLLGINGSGKTTTVAKLANYYSNQNKKVIIGSCDTFRAAANEQLRIWADRTEVKIIEDFSKDPAAVAFETCKTALAENYDVVLIDTAGRLHTNTNLVNELKKIVEVVSKLAANYSLDLFLVLDGNSGQNAKAQLLEFSKIINVSGLIITKLDGTAKGGSVLQLCLSNKIPIKYLGLGEGKDDFVVFNPKDYINSVIA